MCMLMFNQSALTSKSEHLKVHMNTEVPGSDLQTCCETGKAEALK
jgi:hypothetical protein